MYARPPQRDHTHTLAQPAVAAMSIQEGGKDEVILEDLSPDTLENDLPAEMKVEKDECARASTGQFARGGKFGPAPSCKFSSPITYPKLVTRSTLVDACILGTILVRNSF